MQFKYLTPCLNLSPCCLTRLTFSQSFNSQGLPQIRLLSHPKKNPGGRTSLPPGPHHNKPVETLRRLYQTPSPCQELCASSHTRAHAWVHVPFPNPLNLIERPTLERAARGSPLQLSAQTPSPPSTPPHWIKFVNAPSHQFPLDFLP